MKKMMILVVALMAWISGINKGIDTYGELIEMGTRVGIFNTRTVITSFDDEGNVESVERYVRYDDMKMDSKGNYYFKEGNRIYSYHPMRVAEDKANGKDGVFVSIAEE